jgi:choice-of-anchor B domain-containing protein
MKQIFTLKLLVCLVFLTNLVGQVSAQNYNLVERAHLDWPGQTLANICGWTSPTGQEYALIGGSLGLIIVDVTNPDMPVQIVQIPGPNNLWKEIKVYKNYAYVTSEGGQGVQIVDLNGLPSANLTYHYYTGTGALASQLNAIHALHIDTTGFLYLFGGGQTGATVHALEPDPYNPTYVGQYQLGGYVHDGYANNDTLYAGHIYAGKMAIVDMKDKNNPIVLGDVTTPNNFTHNVWPLTSNRHILLTTDERANSFLAAYDTQDPENIVELDRLQTTPGTGSIVHNTHIRNDFAISSWYTDGVTITDATRPINLVQVARFDTYPDGGGDGFDGCWGAFPFFPSGTIVTSNIGSNAPNDPTRLYVLTPTYKRACYLEGIVTDGCTGEVLSDATVKIISNDPLTETRTNPLGVYRTGQPTPGQFMAQISKPGFVTQDVMVTLTTGIVTELNVLLQKPAGINAQVTVTMQNGTSSLPLANTKIQVLDPVGTTSAVTTDAAGQVVLTCVNPGQYRFGLWGARAVVAKNITAAGPVALEFQRGYYDDMELDLGWTNTATSPSGLWVRAEPIGTQVQGEDANPEVDASNDTNDKCYTTGNAGGQSGADDVDGGSVTLSTPPINFTGINNPAVRFAYWFFNAGGQGNPNDKMLVRAVSGTDTVALLTVTTSASAWINAPFLPITGLANLTAVTIQFIAYDDQPGHLVEAGIDIFEVATITAAPEVWLQAELSAQPNPFDQSSTVSFTKLVATDASLELTDISGKLVETISVQGTNGQITVGRNLTSGVYFARLRQAHAATAPFKIVKI